jgi:hypothetical protein
VDVRGSFTTIAHANMNQLRFDGRVAGHKLKPGRYEITATPTTNSHATARRTATFTIVA